MSLITLGNDSFDEFVTNNPLVMVDFYATWCGPCMQIMKLLPKLATDVQDFAVIGKVDVDVSPELKARFHVTKIPTFVFFKGGEEVWRYTGVTRLAELLGRFETLR